MSRHRLHWLTKALKPIEQGSSLLDEAKNLTPEYDDFDTAVDEIQVDLEKVIEAIQDLIRETNSRAS